MIASPTPLPGGTHPSVQALESAKQLTDVPHVKARPIVTDEVCFFGFLFGDTELYAGFFVLACKLPGILLDGMNLFMSRMRYRTKISTRH